MTGDFPNCGLDAQKLLIGAQAAFTDNDDASMNFRIGGQVEIVIGIDRDNDKIMLVSVTPDYVVGVSREPTMHDVRGVNALPCEFLR